MKIYLQDIAKRLLKFNQISDNTTLFIYKPWVLIDTQSNSHVYIFKRDGQLIISFIGQVYKVNWNT